MTTSLTPYLNLAGRCEEALQFYAEALRGRVTTLMRFGDAVGGPEEHAQKIIHAEFQADGLSFMASDGMPSAPPPPRGGRVHLALGFDSTDEQERVFAALAEGGEVTHALHDTFYGGRMGVLTDKFGVDWMLNWMPAKA